jgi:very-short-patch-repair endonuclease
MDALPFILYNTSLKDYAKHNRFQPNLTKAEALFRNIVVKHNKTGYRFLRQKIINFFILDFYCSKLRLGIEIDGGYHEKQQKYDKHRTDILSEYGIKIIRYTNSEVQKNLDMVILDLKKQIKTREKEIF